MIYSTLIMLLVAQTPEEGRPVAPVSVSAVTSAPTSQQNSGPEQSSVGLRRQAGVRLLALSLVLSAAATGISFVGKESWTGRAASTFAGATGGLMCGATLGGLLGAVRSNWNGNTFPVMVHAALGALIGATAGGTVAFLLSSRPGIQRFHVGAAGSALTVVGTGVWTILWW